MSPLYQFALRRQLDAKPTIKMAVFSIFDIR